MFRGLAFRSRSGEDADQPGDGELVRLDAGFATSADLRVATRDFERTQLWCVLGDEGRVVDDPPGLLT